MYVACENATIYVYTSFVVDENNGLFLYIRCTSNVVIYSLANEYIFFKTKRDRDKMMMIDMRRIKMIRATFFDITYSIIVCGDG